MVAACRGTDWGRVRRSIVGHDRKLPIRLANHVPLAAHEFFDWDRTGLKTLQSSAAQAELLSLLLSMWKHQPSTWTNCSA
jgi:hypothetical protein